MAGHSIGGDATSAAMVADPQIRAGANLDGTIHSERDAPIREDVGTGLLRLA